MAEDFLDVAVNCDRTVYQEGFDEGYKDGLVVGKEDARQVGLKKGFEDGEELGFYQGCVDVWNSAIRIDPNCFSPRVRKAVKQMEELIAKFPLKEPENEKLQDIMEALRLKFKAICGSLGVKLEYKGYPNAASSETKEMSF